MSNKCSNADYLLWFTLHPLFVNNHRALLFAMYRRLSITENNAEYMAGFRSLPVSSVLVDSSCRLIDINLQAIFQFNVGRSEIQKEEQFISRIENFQAYVANLSKGVDLYKEKTSMQLIDGRTVELLFSATMLSGTPDLFLFQFY
jgi:hypothetical protein